MRKNLIRFLIGIQLESNFATRVLSNQHLKFFEPS